MKSSLLNKLHLLSRATFGLRPGQLESLSQISLKQLIKQIEHDSSSTPESLIVATEDLGNAYRDLVLKGMPKTPLMQEDYRIINRQNTDRISDLTLNWMAQMVKGNDQLREKIALFWHGHFAARLQNAYFQQQLLDVVRKNALGHFGDLLREVSKSASMLNFLNNQQNRKAHPNENFAREVMELFTLGRGNYTENDVKEGARAFTGWSYDNKGAFVFNKKVHDENPKTFLGKTGNFDGDDILNMLLENKATSVFITRKIYRFFVNDRVVDENEVQRLADKFYQSNYHIQSLMNEIFQSDNFYAPINQRAVIKSPVELLVSIQRILPMMIQNPKVMLVFNNALGQQPFYPPNVAGWAGGTSWIDSSSLMLRLKIPQLIQDNDAFTLTTKSNDDVQMGMGAKTDPNAKAKIKAGKNKGAYSVTADVKWEEFSAPLFNVSQDALFDNISQIVLGTAQEHVSAAAVQSEVSNTSRDAYIKSLTIALMSTPEFQLS